MSDKERTMVEMTPEEKARFEAFKEEEARKAEREAKRELRKQLQEMTDSVMGEAVAELKECSERLSGTKRKILETFSTLMELRKEVNEEAGKKEQDSFTFTNSEGTQRIRIGYNLNDNYLDQVEEGIAKVKAYLESLAKDEQSKELIALVLKLRRAASSSWASWPRRAATRSSRRACASSAKPTVRSAPSSSSAAR